MATIASLTTEVTNALQGRTDISTSVANTYIQRAIQEISESYPFEELRATGPNFVLTAATPVYAISNFLNVGDGYTFPESMGIYVDFPTNTVVSLVKYKTPAAIEQMIAPATQGLPGWFTRFGSNFHLGPTPNAAYTVFLRYQRLHPFSNPVENTTILLPASWEEIIVYSAAERIAVVKRWTDQVKTLHDILYGDPEYLDSGGKRGRPGLIAARLFQVERDQKFNTRQLSVVYPRYNYR